MTCNNVTQYLDNAAQWLETNGGNFGKFIVVAGQVDLGARFSRVNWSVSNALFDRTDHLDKTCKLIIAIVDGYGFFADCIEDTTPVLKLFKSGSKLLAGLLVFGDPSTWTRKIQVNGEMRLEWKVYLEGNKSRLAGIVFFQTGHIIDFMRLNTDLGFNGFVNLGAKLGQYPVLAPFINIGLSQAKGGCVVFGGACAAFSAASTVYSINKDDITPEFVEKQMIGFLCGATKAIVVSAVLTSSPLTPTLFAAGLILGFSNAWKYVTDIDKEQVKPQLEHEQVAADLYAQGFTATPAA